MLFTSVVAGKVFSSQIKPLQHKTTSSSMGCGMVLKGASQPRKALGDLNRRSPILQDQKMAAPSCLKPPAPALKSSRLAEYQLDNYNQQSKQVG